MESSNPKVITCKAAVVWKEGEMMKIEEIQVDPPKSNEVRIKMLFASLCHTDIIASNGFPIPLFPRVLGHEGVGMIESVGENVTNLKEGDIVIPLYLGECRECPNCKSGKSNLCHEYHLTLSGLMLDDTSRMSIHGGQVLYQLFSCATWSEYTVINVNYVIKVDPQKISLQHASLLCCGFTTGYGATWREVHVEKGSTVAVLGLGAVGLGAIEGARSQGASKIIGVDINELKQGKGEVFGMTDFINPKESKTSVSEMIKDVTEGLGVDYVFECTGIPSMLNEAIEASKLGIGTIVVIGAGHGLTRELNLVSLLCGRTLKGSIYGGIRLHSDLPVLLHRCSNKEIQLDELITHQVSLTEISQSFELLKDPHCIKIIIKF
ncbi:alcohol dehydrogenase-like 1 isoform X1 [Solanum pennellii]|uniref:Alcohol dehydrogenase-like 1 isoform X1 n=2 Tax=Solanum pennellii TaxID=28526 RepID=A0ABM1V5L0_SOLPN|nr:alcohol dehydrogenase-like 1 isoform X1 [Solanum pennellii]XP_027771028.1 alcohol dehydrogenase-like 1 isoform X1 [Solanum pennellii]